MNEYPSAKEPTKLFKDEQPTYEQAEIFSGADIHSVRDSSFVLIHQQSMAVFGWVEAAIISRVDFFIAKSKSKSKLRREHGRPWIWHSYEQWMKELPRCSRTTLKRAVSKMEHCGVLLTFQEPHRKFYSINYEAWAYFLADPEALKRLK